MVFNVKILATSGIAAGQKMTNLPSTLLAKPGKPNWPWPHNEYDLGMLILGCTGESL